MHKNNALILMIYNVLLGEISIFMHPGFVLKCTRLPRQSEAFNEIEMHLSSKGTGMDIHTYLIEWQSLEPNRCTFVENDLWSFSFSKITPPVSQYPDEVTCDVNSLYGVGVIEDLIKGCINSRISWTYSLNFDRSEELFQGLVKDAAGIDYTGLESLNPGIALLTAYLNSLREQEAP